MKKDTSNVNELSALTPLGEQDIFIEKAFPFEVLNDSVSSSNTLILGKAGKGKASYLTREMFEKHLRDGEN
ncbi:hypothetical protein [Priestia aryabhattai]|uniref:hypothetical protein n=1 Tax=Priestia aryabhattai TaxID=412384 RepID=UPI001C8D24BE|nr:hypothetical protein [Priestia aryabhattai]MBX9998164.1 hypothetical protein [Priestia aryabhattai]